jgi:hypothetical protein
MLNVVTLSIVAPILNIWTFFWKIKICHKKIKEKTSTLKKLSVVIWIFIPNP